MTKFSQNDFTYDGSYLMYKGNFDGAQLMTDVHPDCHSSWVGKLKPAFVARFKRGGMCDFKNFLIKNFTCEEYFFAIRNNVTPFQTLRNKGYVDPRVKCLTNEGV